MNCLTNQCNSCCSTSCNCCTKTSSTTTTTTTIHIPCEVDNCEEIVDFQCVQNIDLDVECLSITAGDNLETIVAKLFEKLTGYNCSCDFCGVIVENVQFIPTAPPPLN